ncbi:glutathione S-transferase family protein [Frigidibacter sp. ROC022]|uniref:glutathione S-transferase family protein n=1 Tax=Frigidibacter sp. ROC022 TaxID=2971796 RepID=UPI00215B2460|nr:glutathione S-transferase family protein [Frigidibacter sp. ROC022]MCR8722682.1 glutathione S-transferase family protein [Frigidibacter sp. ROC022]
MQLYYAPGTVALAAVIALEEAGAAYDPLRLSFADGDQLQPAYLAVNPKGRVPALVTDDGVLTETPAILRYIAALYPEAGLLPSDPREAARVDELCAYLSATVHVSHAHRARGARWSDDPAVIEALKLKVPSNMAAHFSYLSGQLRGPWYLGEQYSLADAYLFTMERWLPGDGVDLAGLPKIAAHMARVEARPAVQRALAVTA